MRRKGQRSGLRSVIRTVFSELGKGLCYTGFATAMTPSAVYLAWLRRASDAPQGEAQDTMPAPLSTAPPPGHPEQMVADVPPSAEEARLWAGLPDTGN